MSAYRTYQVFVQESHQSNHQHVGSLLAPDDTLALQLARENYCRRVTPVSIWVVQSDHIVMSENCLPNTFSREFDRSYRMVEGYTDNARRWKQIKQEESVHERDVP